MVFIWVPVVVLAKLTPEKMITKTAKKAKTPIVST
jgi:hypothetical protein